MESTVSSLSSETIRFHEIFPDYYHTVPPITRTITIDWKYLSTCPGKSSVAIVSGCLLILILIFVTRNGCDSISSIQSGCIFYNSLLGLSVVTILFNLVNFLLYIFHAIEKFNQTCWLRVEFTCHLMYTVHFTIIGSLIFNNCNYFGFFLAILTVSISFSGLILALDRLIKVCKGKPAQEQLDDADGNRTRIGIMRLRFGIRNV
ncbi:uncharacterized protein LOC128392933 [Panonychus citri]|uniref:uncharacterized protein LOC128392933 n=1 Tax=Panonychus citri TaxID=50023 RepID=UPI002306F67D|nr:uncharacterized protein LOC128392933 [Panonychus citri]